MHQTTKQHRAWLKSIQNLAHSQSAAPPPVHELLKRGALGISDMATAMRQGAGRNEMCWRTVDIYRLATLEVVQHETGFSLITRSAITMSDQITKAAEILDTSAVVFVQSLDKFSATSDRALAEAKKRVSQLNDYSARLGESLSKLQKTLDDPAMARSLENAAALVDALQALLLLQQSGNLAKIFAALQKS